MAGASPLTEEIRCQGRRKDGRTCQQVIAQIAEGVIVVRDRGREHRDPSSTTCARCGELRRFRETDTVAVESAA